VTRASKDAKLLRALLYVVSIGISCTRTLYKCFRKFSRESRTRKAVEG
jgi:hypothetical protein